jgi:hypothetical protein
MEVQFLRKDHKRSDGTGDPIRAPANQDVPPLNWVLLETQGLSWSRFRLSLLPPVVSSEHKVGMTRKSANAPPGSVEFNAMVESFWIR